jgi:hypothetical protein
MSTRFTQRIGAVVLAASVATAAAGCLGGASGDHPQAADATHTQTTEGSDGSTATNRETTDGAGAVAARVEHGVPVGWPLDQHGAEAAAAAYVRSSSLIARSGPLTRRDAVLTMATSSYGPAMVAAVNRELDGLTVGTQGRSVSPQQLVWIEYPLTLTSTMTSATTAQVRVWSVLIVGIDGGSVARQVWRTSTITLEVENRDWKVAAWVGADGPSPVALNDTGLASVADVREVTSWASAGSGS